MTAIADGVRTLSGESGKMGLDAMSEKIAIANTTVDGQSDLIYQIKVALRGKTAGSGEGAKEEQEKSLIVTENGSYEILPDEGKVISKAIVDVEVTAEGGSSEPILIDSGFCGSDATWEFYSDGKFIVSGTGATYDYTSSTSGGWSSYSSDITEVVINEGITRIGNYLCRKFSNTTSVTLASTVETIGDWSFMQSGLVSIDIPEGVINIGNAAFYYCKSLRTVIIPDGVITIGEQAFQDCTSLTNINIPDSVTVLGPHSLRNVDGLTNVVIGNGVTEIGTYTFSGCDNLTSVTIPSGIKTIEANAFRSCPNLTTVFYKGTKSEWDLINISETNNSVLLDATLYCEAKEEQEKTVNIKENGPTEVIPDENKTLSKVVINVNVPTQGGNDYELFAGVAERNILNIGSEATQNIEQIGNHAFYYCTQLQTANFPVCTEIKSFAFAYCWNLTSVSFPACEYVRTSAFLYCSNFTSISFPAVTYLESYAFAHCNKLSEVTFPVCRTIGPSVFRNCSNLTTATFSASYIQSSAFTGCSNLMSFTNMYTSVAALASSKVFYSTPMSTSSYTGAFGSIYVPASLVAAYKAKTNWTVYADRITSIPE
jgi:hypothetical protein